MANENKIESKIIKKYNNNLEKFTKKGDSPVDTYIYFNLVKKLFLNIGVYILEL